VKKLLVSEIFSVLKWCADDAKRRGKIIKQFHFAAALLKDGNLELHHKYL
jgi:hypothetical protein